MAEDLGALPPGHALMLLQCGGIKGTPSVTMLPGHRGACP